MIAWGSTISIAGLLLWATPLPDSLRPTTRTAAPAKPESKPLDPHRFASAALPLSGAAVQEVEMVLGDETYEDENEPCPGRRKLTGSATYRNYQVRTYRWPNISGCFEVLRNGRRIYTETSLLFQIGGSADLADHPEFLTPVGTDVTGDGTPDLVIGEWSGGAHCCYDFSVYELGKKFRFVDRIEAEDSYSAHFADLDQDGRYEFVARDWTFAYWHASFGFSAAPEIILRFRDGRFRLAGDLMRQPRTSKATWNDWLARVQRDKNWQRDEELPDDLLLSHVLLDLIYAGQAQEAERFLEEAWPRGRKGKPAYKQAFRRKLRESPYWNDLLALNGERIW